MPIHSPDRSRTGALVSPTTGVFVTESVSRPSFNVNVRVHMADAVFVRV